MTTDIIQANYDQLETIAGKFGQLVNSSSALHSRLAQTSQQLKSGGWEGAGAAAFFSEMEGEIFPALQRLTSALEQGQTVTRQSSSIIREAEEEAAALFGGGGENSVGWINIGGMVGIGDGVGRWANPIREFAFFTTGDSNRTDGTTIEREGFYIKETDVRANLVQVEGGFGGSVFSEQFGDFTVSAIGYEAGASADLGLSEDGLTGHIEAGGAVYVGQIEYDAEMAGFDITAEAMAGASVQGRGQVEGDILEGEVELEGEINAFAGVSAEGRASRDIGPAEVGVTGEFGAGIGINASGEIEFEDGKFSIEGDISAFFGVGGGVGVDIEVDIPEAIDTVADIGKGAVDIGEKAWDFVFGG